MHLCNTTSLEDVDIQVLAQFGDRQRGVYQENWIPSNPIWVELPEANNYGNQKSEGSRGLVQAQNQDKLMVNGYLDPELKVMEQFMDFFSMEFWYG